LLEAAGIASKLDEGCMAIGARKDATAFLELCAIFAAGNGNPQSTLMPDRDPNEDWMATA
jgi:hypothetical protein